MTNKERAKDVNKYLSRWEKHRDFSGFTSEAKALILNAARLAMYMGDEKIGTEYLLLAGAKLEKTEIYYELTSQGITADRVAEKIKKVQVKAKYPTCLMFADFTPTAKAIIGYAVLQGGDEVMSRHILKGLCYSKSSTAFQIMADILEDVKREKEERRRGH